jgi:hypothetical protein
MPYLEQMSLKRLDAFPISPVSTIPLLRRIYRRKVHQYCFKALTFTAGNTKTQLTEPKNVSKRKL